jgi:phosphopantetheinyl transferase
MQVTESPFPLTSFNSIDEVILHQSASEYVIDFHRAHVWFCDLDKEEAHGPAHESVLSSTERASAGRLKRPGDRRRFVAKCSFVRQTLGNLTGIAPWRLQFEHDLNGKPHLASTLAATHREGTGFEYNISHSENILALAVAFGRDVGIDIEVVHPIGDVITLADSFLTKDESVRLGALPPRERYIEFYRNWTREEALAKWDGRGLVSRSPLTAADMNVNLSSFEITVGGKEFVGAVAASPGVQDGYAFAPGELLSVIEYRRPGGFGMNILPGSVS